MSRLNDTEFRPFIVCDWSPALSLPTILLTLSFDMIELGCVLAYWPRLPPYLICLDVLAVALAYGRRMSLVAVFSVDSFLTRHRLATRTPVVDYYSSPLNLLPGFLPPPIAEASETCFMVWLRMRSMGVMDLLACEPPRCLLALRLRKIEIGDMFYLTL